MDTPSKIPDFVAIHLDQSQIGIVRVVDGQINSQRQNDLDTSSIGQLIFDLDTVDYVVAFGLDSQKAALKRVLTSFGIPFPDKHYICAKYWTKYTVGEMNLGSACIHFHIAIEEDRALFWSPEFKAKITALLTINLHGLFNTSVSDRASRDQDILKQELAELGFIRTFIPMSI